MILYTDKTEIFECNVSVDGASIENTKARLVVEGKKWNLVFYGDVENNGKCKINIGNLSIFNEGESGKIRLEIIADDTVFTPWKDDFSIKTNKKVTVEVLNNNSQNTTLSESKTKVAVNVQIPKESNSQKECLTEISDNLNQNNITLDNINENEALFRNIIFKNMKKYGIAKQQNLGWIVENITEILKKS